MYFPVLSALRLKIDCTIQFLGAVIAPNLEHCDATLEDHLPLLMFSGLGSEFSSVQRLSIHSRIRSFTDEKGSRSSYLLRSVSGCTTRGTRFGHPVPNLCGFPIECGPNTKLVTLWISGKIWKPYLYFSQGVHMITLLGGLHSDRSWDSLRCASNSLVLMM